MIINSAHRPTLRLFRSLDKAMGLYSDFYDHSSFFRVFLLVDIHYTSDSDYPEVVANRARFFSSFIPYRMGDRGDRIRS